MRTEQMEHIQVAQELLRIIEIRKDVEKREKELKDSIKSLMGSEVVLEAGNIIITLEDRNRTDLDKKGLAERFGLEVIKQFEKITSFKLMNVICKG